MRKMAPKLTAIILLLPCLNSQAQLKLPVTNNDLGSNLSKILSDYATGFFVLKGDTISVTPQSIEFATKLDFPGCEDNSIIQYKAKTLIYSWQALLLTTDDFEEASQKYKWLCNQLKVMAIKVQDYSCTLSGDYNKPEENKKFCSSIFSLTANTTMPKLKIEALIQFEFPEWKVSLLVYERDREDDERGDSNGN